MGIWECGGVKTTLEIDDELYREAKAMAALTNRKMKDMVSAGLRQILCGGSGMQATGRRSKKLSSKRIYDLKAEAGSESGVPLVRSEDLSAWPNGDSLRKAFPRGYRLLGALIPSHGGSLPARAKRVAEALEAMDQEELRSHARAG